MIDIQTQCFLNIRDNNDISFTEIYKEAKQIKDVNATEV